MKKTILNMTALAALGALLMLCASVLAVGCGGGKDSSASGKSAASKDADTLVDDRDGQRYRIVKIGNQTWMAENLRFDVGGGSWCYENSEDSCKKYGRLYNWYMAKKACPNGWHLPSNDEWTELVTVVGLADGGKKLKSKSGWNEVDGKSGNGTDDFGFAALPGGGRVGFGGFSYIGTHGNWWTTSTYGSDTFSLVMLNDRDTVIVSHDSDTRSEAYSVRCIAD